MDKLNERVIELCQVGSVISDHMRYVGRQWQQAIETLTQKKINVDALKITDTTNPVPTPIYESQRKKSIAIKGDYRPLKGKRPGKCWYCTERHGRSGCTRATDDAQKWLQDAK
jgi:hypothetical protein